MAAVPASSSSAGRPLIRPVRDDELADLAVALSRTWGSSRIVSRGVVHDIEDLPCLLAVDGERRLGVAAYRLAGGECELVLLEAFERGAGVGTGLLGAVVELARESNSRRLWLVTTNSNLDALRFYQHRGLRIVRVWADAWTMARESLKPEIPDRGDYGIPILDELELELVL